MEKCWNLLFTIIFPLCELTGWKFVSVVCVLLGWKLTFLCCPEFCFREKPPPGTIRATSIACWKLSSTFSPWPCKERQIDNLASSFMSEKRFERALWQQKKTQAACTWPFHMAADMGIFHRVSCLVEHLWLWHRKTPGGKHSAFCSTFWSYGLQVVWRCCGWGLYASQ